MIPTDIHSHVIGTTLPQSTYLVVVRMGLKPIADCSAFTLTQPDHK